MPDITLDFPVGGVDLSRAFYRQPKLTTPVAVNVRSFEPSESRARGGSRSGLIRWIDARVDGTVTLVQHMNVVILPTEAAQLGNFNWDDGFDDEGEGGTTNPQTGGEVRTGGSGNNPGKKKTPLIDWDNPANVEADGGTGLFALTFTQLNAVVRDPFTLLPITLQGSTTYNPTVTFSMSPGLHQSLRVTWVPDRLTSAGRNYRTARKRVFINVLPPGGGGVETWTFVGLVTGGGAGFNGVLCDVTGTGSLGGSNMFSQEVFAPFPPAEPGGNFLIGNTYPLNASDNTDPFGGVLTFA